jgi:hypothetical protein
MRRTSLRMMLGLRDRWYPEKILKNAKLDLVNIKMIRCKYQDDKMYERA